MYTVYKTVNLVNGKYYIGVHKTDNPNDGYLGSGKLIKAAITKYGVDSFKKEIIAIFEDKNAAYQLEAELVIIGEDSYNLKNGGEGGFDHINDGSEEHKLRCSNAGKRGSKATNAIVAHRIETDEEYYVKWLNQQRVNISKAHSLPHSKSFLGKSHTTETKHKMSEKGKEIVGAKNSQYGTMWITNGVINKKIKSTDDLPNGFYRGRV